MSTLTYLEDGDGYAVYEDEDLNEVYLQDGGFRRLVAFDDIVLDESWKQFQQDEGFPVGSWGLWLEDLRNSVIDPECVDDVVQCQACCVALHNDDAHNVAGDNLVCEACVGNYSFCRHCEELTPDTTRVLDTLNHVCEGCVGNYYNWCEDCEGYYDPENYSHDHDHSCECESPLQDFAIRNNGEEPLTNDTRVSVGLPAGVISEEGLHAISNILRSTGMAFNDPEASPPLYRIASPEALQAAIGCTWQTRQGNFTKRLGSYLYKKHVKLPADTVSSIGTIAREHSTATSMDIEITRDLNLSAEDFGNEGSCWWNSYALSRCALKSSGGFALRSFEADDCYPSGRAWVLPLKAKEDGRLTPTFETVAPAAFVVFNGYGDLAGYTPARILAHMAGMTYRKIGFECAPMYINCGGYLVAAEEIASKYTDGSLYLTVDQHSTLFESERKETENVA